MSRRAGTGWAIFLGAICALLWSYSRPTAALAQVNDPSTIMGPGITVESGPNGGEMTPTVEKSQYGTYEKALVREASDDSSRTQAGGQRKFNYVLEITSGALKGKTQELSVRQADLPEGIDPQVGDKLVIFLQSVPGQDKPTIFIESQERQTAYFFVFLALVGLAMVLAGSKGLKAFLILLPILSFYWIMLPLQGFGFPGWLTLLITLGLLVPLTGLFLIGHDRKLAIVSGSTIIGSLVSYATILLLSSLSRLGSAGLEGQDGFAPTRSLVLAMLCGVLIFDMANHIARGLAELKDFSPGLDKKEVFKAGMVLGKERFFSVLPILSVFFLTVFAVILQKLDANSYPWLRFINSEPMAESLVLPAAFGIGLIFSIPIISALSVLAWARTPKTEDPLKRALGWRPDNRPDMQQTPALEVMPEVQYEESNPALQG